jgi:hypothetical protein
MKAHGEDRMSLKVLGGTALVLVSAATLAACDRDRHGEVRVTETQVAAQSEPTGPVATATTPTVPEMKPTGDMQQAVKPNAPHEKSSGAAPVLAPTGNQREPYVEKKP